MDINEDIIKSWLRNLLITFNDIVEISSDDFDPSKLLPHHIELIDGEKPIKQRAYRLYQIQLIALKEKLKKLIDKGLISPSHSSSIVLVPKKNGRWRTMCRLYIILFYYS